MDNCQILQSRVNRLKGNQDNDLEKLKGYSCAYRFTEPELDTIELALYGDIKRADYQCRCPSVMEAWESWKASRKSKKQQAKAMLPVCPGSTDPSVYPGPEGELSSADL